MNELVLIDDRSIIAGGQIARLEKKRQEHFELLERLRSEMETFFGKPPLLSDIEEWVTITEEYKIKIKILEHWLQKQTVSFDLTPLQALTAIGVPQSAQALLSAWKEVTTTQIEDWLKYWSHKKQCFEMIKISDVEKEAIKERNKVFATPENAEVAAAIKSQISVINHANYYHNINILPSTIRQMMPWIIPYLKWNEMQSKRGLKCFYFELDQTKLYQFKTGEFKAFDE